MSYGYPSTDLYVVCLLNIYQKLERILTQDLELGIRINGSIRIFCYALVHPSIVKSHIIQS